MYDEMLKVKDCLFIMQKFGINMSEPAFRQSIRLGKIRNTSISSKRKGANIPLISLMNFMIDKVGGNHDAFELGKFYMKILYEGREEILK